MKVLYDGLGRGTRGEVRFISLSLRNAKSVQEGRKPESRWHDVSVDFDRGRVGWTLGHGVRIVVHDFRRGHIGTAQANDR